MSKHPSFLPRHARGRAGGEPIFALNAEAARRAAAGEDIVNATVGALVEDDGTLAILPVVTERLAQIAPTTAAAYAPITGVPIFGTGVIDDLLGNSPVKDAARAVATPGGSGALHLAITTFLEPGQALLVPSYYWGPYQTIAEQSHRTVCTFTMFDADGRLNLTSFAAELARLIAEQGRALIVFNFPCNNPTGYSLDDEEWREVAEIVYSAGRRAPVAFLIDHAYARFRDGDGDGWLRYTERMLESALVLVAWTASKSFAQYGSRIGALVVIASDTAESEQIHGALDFACRGTWATCNHAGQLAVGQILTTPALKARLEHERAGHLALLRQRSATFNRTAASKGLRYPRYEGGFFVAVFTADGPATAAAMRGRGVFVIPMRGAVRVALCSTPEARVELLTNALAEGIFTATGTL